MQRIVILSVFVAVFIAGEFFASPTAQAQADEWTYLTSGITNDLNGISCPEDSVCYVVGGAPFIGGSGVILKTTDGGDTWVSQTLPLTNPLRGISCVSATLCYAAGDGGAILKTTNGGASWSRLGVNTPAGEQWYWDIAAADAAHATAVGNGGMVYRTTNGGTSWSRVELNTSENLNRIHFANAAIGFMVGTNGKVWKTINAGASWSLLTTPASLNTLSAVDSPDGTNVWVGGDVGRILKSTNGGLGLTLLRPDTISSFRAIAFLDGTTGWLGGGGVIKRTDNGGATWAEEKTGILVILRDMFCSSAVCYAVGDDGTILRRGEAAARAPEQGDEEEETSITFPTALSNFFSGNLSGTQKGIAEAPSKRTTGTKRLRGVTINSNLLNQSRIRFNFFVDQELVGEITKREERPNGVKVWKGTIEGKPENLVTLVSKGNILAGNIRTDEGVIELRYASNGAYTLRLIDPNLLPDDLHPAPPEGQAVVHIPASPPSLSSAEIVTVDVLILITPQAYDALGDDPDAVGAAIDLMVEEANSAYELSNAYIRLRRVHAQGVGGRIYNDSGDLRDDLDALTSDQTFLGSMASNLRDDVDADLTTLLVRDGGGSCGIAWQMNEANEFSFADDAYSVVDTDCLPNYSYPHELGHNMGLQHDRDSAEDSTPRYTYAYGYQDPQSRFRTIMAYPCASECSRIPFFSTPDPSVAYRGIPFGTATEDNARALRNSRSRVANYSETRGSGEADVEASGDEATKLQEATGIKASAPSGGTSGFFKNLGRAIRTFFTFNSEKKAGLKLTFANEDLLAAQKLLAAGKEDAASRTLEDFRKNLDAAEKLGGETLKPKLLETQLKQQKVLRALSREVKSEEVKEKIVNLSAQEFERAVDTVKKIGGKALETLKKENIEIEAKKPTATSTTRYIQELKALKKQADTVMESLLLILKKSLVDMQEDKEYYLKKLEMYNTIGEELSEYLSDLIDQSPALSEASQNASLKKARIMLQNLEALLEEVLARRGARLEGKKSAVPYPAPPTKEEAKATTSPTVSPCTKNENLICGVNGLTYLNECFLKDAKVQMAYKGACKSITESTTKITTPTPEPTTAAVCTKEYAPVCGVNNLTYQNECFLKDASVALSYKGECKTTEAKTMPTPTPEPTPSPEPEPTLAKPTISSFGASPSSISAKQSVTLSWSISGAESIVLENTKESLSASGKITVMPTESTTYTITATNKAGSVSSSVKVYVKSSY
ncbi:hypothetical protein HY414_00360 [Candidatus Kaiserbacteria bacterium]|nr:hypothetical protein [Candidatus Kaiserbacteria bacterium]